jgi:hypothetical protein
VTTDVAVDGVPDSGEGRASIGKAISAFRGNLVEQAAWNVAKHFADAVSPGAGTIVTGAYIAIKAVTALHTINNGDGFFVILPGEVPGSEVALSIGVRQMSEPLGVQFRVDLMDHVYVEDAPRDQATHTHHGEWPGEWTLQYGLAGIREHGAVLGGRTVRVIRLDDGPRTFADEPSYRYLVDWMVLTEQKRCRITVRGLVAMDTELATSPGTRE